MPARLARRAAYCIYCARNLAALHAAKQTNTTTGPSARPIPTRLVALSSAQLRNGLTCAEPAGLRLGLATGLACPEPGAPGAPGAPAARLLGLACTEADRLLGLACAEPTRLGEEPHEPPAAPGRRALVGVRLRERRFRL